MNTLPGIEPGCSGRADSERFVHPLGEFDFAKTLRFKVFADDACDPKAARVVLDDGIQEPYAILTVEGLGRLDPAPITRWRKGWIDERDPWARVIYGNMIGIVRQTRSRGAENCGEAEAVSG